MQVPLGNSKRIPAQIGASSFFMQLCWPDTQSTPEGANGKTLYFSLFSRSRSKRTGADGARFIFTRKSRFDLQVDGLRPAQSWQDLFLKNKILFDVKVTIWQRMSTPIATTGESCKPPGPRARRDKRAARAVSDGFSI